MQEALNIAKIGLNKSEVPVGAVIIHPDHGIIAQQHNLVEAHNNPTAHAEILAIQEACCKLESRYLNECYMYSTLEPCQMCSYAIILSRISKLYFAAYDLQHGGIESKCSIFYNSNNINNKPEIYGGIMENESKTLLKFFFQNLRKKKKT